MGKLEKIEKCVQKGKEDELVKLVHDRDKNVRPVSYTHLTLPTT